MRFRLQEWGESEMGTKDAAQQGLNLIKDAILAELRSDADGLGNADLAERLGLRSDIRGKQRNYLSYSVLGLLLAEGRIMQRNDKKWEIAP